jgi:hypothetical protein
VDQVKVDTETGTVYSEAIQSLSEDEIISKHLDTPVGTIESSFRLDCDTILRFFVIDILNRLQSLGFDEGVFDTVYEGIEDFFYRDTLEYRCFSPLEGFNMEGEGINLDSNLCVIKFPEEDKKEILKQAAVFGWQSWSIVHDEFALEMHVNTPKVVGLIPEVRFEDAPNQIASQRFGEVCEALRIFKKGTVGYDRIRVTSTTWVPHSGTTSYGPNVPRRLIGPRYTLSKEECKEFVGFWSTYQKVKQLKRNRIETATRRFNFAYERSRPEDRLIDYMIAFETLLSNERVGELSYRLSLRGAALLGTSPEEREGICQALHNGYRERSTIVHEGTHRQTIKLDNNEMLFKEFVDVIEGYLRSTIKKFVLMCGHQREAQVVEQLDRNIKRGSFS